MTNYNFIGIGINHYQHLQPLSYAQADIQGLERFFCEEARVHPRQTLTFTDNSSWVNERGTYPTKKNLTAWLRQGFYPNAAAAPGSSVLWFAFSGYGIQHEGEDYLLPVDGKLDNPVGTGIPVREVFDALRQQGAGKIIALLDMNRSGAVLGNGEVGEQTLELAGQMGIATVLSCKPDEFSHETSALGHGMFTASVLEALRYYRSDVTLDLLNNYLGDRLKELSEHHWRPVQTPIMVIPSLAAQRELILPSADSTKISWKTSVPMGASLATLKKTKGAELPTLTNGHGKSSHIYMGTNSDNVDDPEFPPSTTIPATTDTYSDFGAGHSESLDNFGDNPLDDEIFNNEQDTDPTEPAIMPHSFDKPREKKQPWYLAGWQWLALLLLLLLGGLAWKLFNGSTPEPTATQPLVTDLEGDGGDGTGATSEDPPSGTETEATDPAAANGGDGASAGTGANGANGEGTASNPTATAGNPTSPAGNGGTTTGTEGSATANGGSAGNPTNGSETSGNPANGTAQSGTGQTTEASPSKTPSTLLTNGQQAQTQNESILTEANLVLRSSQASSFNDAIAAARSVKPGTPLYNEARTQINRWSRVILDIAEARAIKGDLSGAIAAARLVPPDVPQVYGIAQNSINKWQSQLSVVQRNRQVIANAKELIIPNQASSYSKAIALLKTIKPSEPIFREARSLQDQWSRTIYLLANSRAAKGNYKLAVETAKLVPADSPSYKSALGAIARWQKGVR